MELSLFELAWHLAGMEKYLMGMAMEEDWAAALDQRVEEWTRALPSALSRRALMRCGSGKTWEARPPC